MAAFESVAAFSLWPWAKIVAMKNTLRVGLALAVISGTVAAQGIQYPVTPTVDHVDTYHGTKVPIPIGGSKTTRLPTPRRGSKPRTR